MPAKGSHGVLVDVELTPNTAIFTTIGELGGTITWPALSRPATETTPHNKLIDAYVTGRIAREALTFPINYDSGESTHAVATGLVKLLKDKTTTGFRLRGTDSSVWIMSGEVINIAPQSPVREGATTANISVRPSGGMMIDGVSIG